MSVQNMPKQPAGGGERKPAARSLARKLIVSMLIGETVFALVLGVAVGAQSAISTREQTLVHYRETADLVATSLIPMVMDKDAAAVQLQMESLVELQSARRLQCIRLADGAGNIVAEAGGTGPDCCTQNAPTGLLSWVQTGAIVTPLDLNGVRLGTVSMQFTPLPLTEALLPATLLSLVVMASVTFVSVPWIAWLSTKLLLLPLAEVQDAADRLANGQRELSIDTTRRDEMGEISRTLQDLGWQLAQREARLSEALGSAKRALIVEARAKREVEQMYTEKSNFVAIASHELRTPLAAIRMYADLMLEQVEEGSRAVLQELAIGMRASAVRLSSITADLLDAAMLERGIMPLELREVDLSSVCRELVADAQRLAAGKGLSIRDETCADPVVVRADEIRLRQVFDNLVSNAMKFSPPGSTICIRCRSEGTEVLVDVIDQGDGIDTSQIDRLFTLFGRLDSEDNRKTAGLGLGLAISARIVEALGGRVSWSPGEHNVGTVFTVTLPRINTAGVVQAQVRMLDQEEDPATP